MSTKKILYIHTAPSNEDRKAWSGTVFQTFNGLKNAGFEVDYLCALRDNTNTILDKLYWEYWKIIPKILGKNFRCDESFYSVNIFRHTLKEFDYSPYDIIFVPTHIAIVNALPKHIKAKIVHLVDATVDSLFNYYTEFSNLLFHNYWEAHVLGKRAFERSNLIIASSDWCKENAIKDYNISPDKIKVIEFGSNINTDDIPASPKLLDGKKHFNIYWSGVNWERKGGDIAIECCMELINRGYNITFNITGMKKLPGYISNLPYVKNYGFLDKNNPEEYHHLISIMNDQDIFLFPSKAECSSIALCEANGFGMPCFAYNTGGLGNYIINANNGYMLPLSASGKDFADKIINCINKHELNKLSLNATKIYISKLNWNVWSYRVSYLLKNL